MKMSVLFIAAHEEWGLGAQLVFGINVLMAVAGVVLLLRKKTIQSGKSSFKVRLWEVGLWGVIVLVGCLLIGVFVPLSKPPVFEPVMEVDDHHDGFFRIAAVKLKEKGYGHRDNNTTNLLPQYTAGGKLDYRYLNPDFLTGGNLAGPTYPDGSSSSKYQGDSGYVNYPTDTYPAILKVNIADAADVAAGVASSKGDIVSMEVVSGGAYTNGLPAGGPITGGVGYREAPEIDFSGLVPEHRLGFLPVLVMFAIYWISRKENYPNLVGIFRMGWLQVMSDALIRLLCAWPALLAISFISSQVLSGYPKQESVQKLAETQSLNEVFNIACYALVVAPVLEEFLFRGILFRAMKRPFGVGPALIISGILFGFVHQNVLSFVPLTFLGIILALSYERTGDLRTCILIHAGFNGFMVLSILVGHGF